MFRRIECVPAYHASVAALPRTREVRSFIRALIRRATERPEEAEVLAGTNARAVYSLRTVTCPALCLFYSLDATTIYLLHVEELDDIPDDE